MSMSNSYILHHLHKWMDSQKDREFNILDVGSGHGRWGYFIKLEFPEVRLCDEVDDHLKAVGVTTHITGIDVLDSLMAYARNLGVAYDRLMKVDLENQRFPFQDKEFDIGVSIGVLAHLSKSGGLRTINEMLRTCDHVLVNAPSFHFTHQHGDLLNDPLEGGGALSHKSTWNPGEFRALGLQVRGFSMKGRLTRTYIDSLLYWFPFRLPQLAGGLIAWK